MSSDKLPNISNLISFNCENLTLVIKALMKQNDSLNSKISELSYQLASITNNKDEVDNLMIKVKTLTLRVDESQETMHNHGTKFMEIEGKVNEMSDKVTLCCASKEDNERMVKVMEEKVELHESNLNNLNRVVEAQVKAFETEKEVSEGRYKEMIDIKKDFEDFDGRLKKIVEDCKEDVAMLEAMIDHVDANAKEQGHKIIKKISEVEKKCDSAIEGSGGVTIRKDDNAMDKVMNMDMNKEEVVRDDAREDEPRPSNDGHSSIMFEYHRMIHGNNYKEREVDSQQLNEVMEMIKTIKEEHSSYMNYYQIELEEIKESLKTMNEEENNPSSTSPSKIKQILGTINSVMNNMNDKATKEDITNINSNISDNIKAISSKVDKSIIQLENKFSLIESLLKASTGSGGIDSSGLLTQLNNQIISTLQSPSTMVPIIQQSLSKCSLSSNPVISQLKHDVENHTEELNKAFISIVDIRNNLLDKKVEEDVGILQKQVDEVTKRSIRLNQNINDIVKVIEGDPYINENEEDIDYDNTDLLQTELSPLRSILNQINTKITEMVEKDNSLERKQVEIHKNILNIIKQDLKSESNRILDEFKVNLKMSIGKIEDQLKDKVNMLNLAELSQRMDNKLQDEIKHKLDKVDLNRNNHVIKKKIDGLENKISKVFVDTLIDLQLEEAPLIVKKNMKPFDRCASCNQVVTLRHSTMLSPSDSSMSMRMKAGKLYGGSNNITKEKFPEINPY